MDTLTLYSNSTRSRFYPGHAFLTAYLAFQSAGIYVPKEALDSQVITKWMVFDSTTGEVVNTQNDLTKLGKQLNWLYKPYDQI